MKNPAAVNTYKLKATKSIIDVVLASGQAPELPSGLEPAIKFLYPSGRTFNEFDWWVGRNRWVYSRDGFNPKTCLPGGLHVAYTIEAAQSGGGSIHHCLWVGVDPDECGKIEGGKRKAPRVYVAGPINLIRIISQHGESVNLDRADLSGALMLRAYLPHASCYRTKMMGADLRYVIFSQANLQEAVFDGADLSFAEFPKAYMRNAVLKHVNARGIILSEVSAVDADFEMADMCYADCGKANFRKASLSGAVLINGYAENADFRSANMKFANLQHLRAKGANFSYADLTYADLRFADLTGAKFEGANITGANFRHAKIDRAFFEGAKGDDFII